MSQFSIKRLLGSVALVAVGLSAIGDALARMAHNQSPAVTAVHWFIMWPALVAAGYNLSSRPLRGAALGLIAAAILAIIFNFMAPRVH